LPRHHSFRYRIEKTFRGSGRSNEGAHLRGSAAARQRGSLFRAVPSRRDATLKELHSPILFAHAADIPPASCGGNPRLASQPLRDFAQGGIRSAASQRLNAQAMIDFDSARDRPSPREEG
jgi:hypothetical protein